MGKKLLRIWGVCVLLCCLFAVQVNAAARTIKVGYFSNKGYHMMRQDQVKSGYGYDFLQMLLRYNDWKYDFVGYDKNWSDMLSMLDRGEIDMVSLANRTPEREQKFAFSSNPVGYSSTILTMKSDNGKIVQGDYKTYNGARVGLVPNSIHTDNFPAYAARKGFTYTPVFISGSDKVIEELQKGNIDLALTSNMRELKDEVVLDEYNAQPYYIAVRKDNTRLLEEINTGLAQLDTYSPDWQRTLFRKYYSNINARAISLSLDERRYLEELKKSGKVIKVAVNPELKPYAFYSQGEIKGLLPTIFKEICARIGIKYEILPAQTRMEYKAYLKSGQADIDLSAYGDYSLAQMNNLKETERYLTTSVAMLSRQDSNLDPKSMIVAALPDPTEFVGYNNILLDGSKTKTYHSFQECYEAVKKGEADATYCYAYMAEQAVMEDFSDVLKYNILPDYTFGLCLGVSDKADYRLLSVLNKAVTSLQPALIQKLTLENSTLYRPALDSRALLAKHPLAVALGLVALILLGICLLILVQRNRAQKKALLVSQDRDRFMGYVCESYALVTEINLQDKTRKDYKMVDGNLTEENKPFADLDEKYFGKIVLPEDLKRVVQFYSPGHVAQLRKNNSQQTIEYKRLEDGQYIWRYVVLKPLEVTKARPNNFIVFRRNIQSEKLAEEQQQQTLKDALLVAQSASTAKGLFLSRMSHEIRTPLNAIIGYMDIAEFSKGDSDKINHCIESCKTAGKHLLNIINDILDISSIESGRIKISREPFDLKMQLTNLSTMFYNQAKNKKVQFKVKINELTQEWVIGDSLRMNQVLMNLLSNAIKFTPEGGSVTLKVDQMKREHNLVFMKFVISDTGIGMSQEYMSRLFKPFEQESAVTAQKYGGTGLGLSIAYNLVQLMGGSIDVDSEQNKGTDFTVTLSFQEDHERHGSAPQDYSHVRVLVVDDDKDSCEYMKGLLKRCKVKCDVVNDGKSAIKRIKGRMGTDYAYDMCLMDWNMPEMDGVETAHRIRQECDSQLPIIIATAYDVSAFAARAKEIGVTKIISKPLFQSTMFDLLVSTYGKYEPKTPVPEENDESLKGKHLLLAEDNPMNQEIAVDILTKAGFIVEAVADGKQALDKFTGAPAGTYDAVLMDIQMPVMDGYQATEAIRKSAHPEAATIPIVAMTANAFTEDVNAALASGMNGHIAKPVNYRKLYDVLKKSWNL